MNISSKLGLILVLLSSAVASTFVALPLGRKFCVLNRDPLPPQAVEKCQKCAEKAVYREPPEYIIKGQPSMAATADFWRDYTEAVKLNSFRYFCNRHTLSPVARPGPYILAPLLTFASVSLLLWICSLAKQRAKAVLVLVSAATLAVAAAALVGNAWGTANYGIIKPSKEVVCDRCDQPAVYSRPGTMTAKYGGRSGVAFADAWEKIHDSFSCEVHATSFRHHYPTYTFVFIVAFPVSCLWLAHAWKLEFTGVGRGKAPPDDAK